ncbi:adenine deaminase [Crocinitomix algicola]|uniref:adenine deaminase n=1 Tax=Crocinitomix algicola TaxID=1740263 RepID=UPI0008733EF3|nr:adenine deaminase [Crocinitomix algicola]
MTVKGNIVDIENQQIYKGEVLIENGKIKAINRVEHSEENYILPGFIDAHIHIESSMLVPSEFARIAVKHGTTATVSDPHEIANVLGIEGVNFMVENGNKVPFKFNFGAPSCVPATAFETAGATIEDKGIKELLERPEILYLAEMMNYPGVIYKDESVLKKLAWAKHFNKPIDGHAPGLMGDDLSTYINSGISTDHESYTFEEGLEKLQKGMKILVREGSAAKNFNALIPLAKEWADMMMFCSDDKHPDDLLVGHINTLVERAIDVGIPLFSVLKMACINPVKHYNLNCGLLNIGDDADFIVVKDLKNFKVQQTFINGDIVYDMGESKIQPVQYNKPNYFNCAPIKATDLSIKATEKTIRVIEALDGELITKKSIVEAKIENGQYVSDIDRDLLKIVVINRYNNSKPAVGFIKNFGLKEGAIASSVAHDSHNIIVVGTDDQQIAIAANAIIAQKGGIAAASPTTVDVLPLPIAGIISDKSAEEVGPLYEKLDLKAKEMGSTLRSPYMTLSFMALLVIPQLKMSDLGLFDGEIFEFSSLSIK